MQDTAQSTVKSADRVLDLLELLARRGVYAALWSRQREVDAAQETLRRAGVEEGDDERVEA